MTGTPEALTIKDALDILGTVHDRLKLMDRIAEVCHGNPVAMCKKSLVHTNLCIELKTAIAAENSVDLGSPEDFATGRVELSLGVELGPRAKSEYEKLEAFLHSLNNTTATDEG